MSHTHIVLSCIALCSSTGFGACSSSSSSGEAEVDAGLPDATSPITELLDTDFPSLADVNRFRQIVLDDNSLYVMASQTLRLDAADAIDGSFSWEGGSQNPIVFIDGQNRPLELFVDAGPDEWGVVAHNTDGSLDFRFDNGARKQFETPIAHSHDISIADATIADESGMIVVGSIASRDPSETNKIWAVRLRNDGTLDPSFGSEAGYALVDGPLGELFEARTISLAPNGDIVIGGNGQVYNPIVIVLTSDGSLNSGFGENGVLQTNLGTRGIGSMVVDEDGRIAVGTTSLDSPIVARYLPNGALDSGYGAMGIQEVAEFRGVIRLLSLAPDGGLVVVGSAEDLPDPEREVFWTRLQEDGSPIVGIQNEAVHIRKSGYITSAVDQYQRVLLVECEEFGTSFCNKSRLVRLNH